MLKVKELRIWRTESYATPPHELRGEVEVVNDNAKMTIRLSNAALGAIFNIIAIEAGATAREEAASVTKGLKEAAVERSVLEHFTIDAESN